MKAVRFDDDGGVEVLEVREVARPEPGPDQVLVAVRAAGINASEATMRAGLVRDFFPSTFPSGQGSDLAGVVEEVGASVNGVAVGDEVIGYTDNRASHAEYVVVERSPPAGWFFREQPLPDEGVDAQIEGADRNGRPNGCLLGFRSSLVAATSRTRPRAAGATRSSATTSPIGASTRCRSSSFSTT